MKPTQDTLSPFTEKSCFPQKHGPFVGTFLLCFISCFISFLIFIEMKARESTILFLLLVGWELVAGEHLLVDECPSLLPLSDFGELAKERKEVILSMYNQGTGTLPCRGLREDWREVLCFFLCSVFFLLSLFSFLFCFFFFLLLFLFFSFSLFLFFSFSLFLLFSFSLFLLFSFSLLLFFFFSLFSYSFLSSTPLTIPLPPSLL